MFNREGFRKALDAFDRAIAIDPRYGAAYAGIANCHLWIATDYARPIEEGEKGRAAALAALQRDPELADAHAALGMVKWRFDFDWPGAEREFKRAVDLDPGSPANHHKYGWYLALLGRVDESKKEMAEARRLDPMSLPIIVDEGLPFYVARDYDGAYRLSKQSVDMNPRFSMGYYDLGLTYAARRDFANAIGSFQKAIPLDDDPENLAGLGYAYALAGRRDDALKVLTQLDSLSKQRYVSPGSVALIYSALGARDEAFAWFDKAVADRSWTLLFAKVDPRFDPLRTDPRFGALLKRIGL
jgi:serine/threonine-protein kinase